MVRRARLSTLLMLQEAQAAKQHTQGYNLDRRHAFKVNMFDEFDKYLKVSDSYEEPENKEYAPTENLQVCLRLIDSFASACAAVWPSAYMHLIVWTGLARCLANKAATLWWPSD